MKTLWICILVVVSLVSCARMSSDSWKCDTDEQVCVYLLANEPVSYGDPVVVTVTVTSEREIPLLYITLAYDESVVIEGIESWEDNLKSAQIGIGWASWGTAINANQTLTFPRTLYLPPREGHFNIIASIGEKNTFRASNGLTIVMTSQGGSVYLANTPIPRTPGPVRLPTYGPDVLETLLAIPTTTPRVTLTLNPTKTSTPTSVPYPQPPTPPGEGPIVEPYP